MLVIFRVLSILLGNLAAQTEHYEGDLRNVVRTINLYSVKYVVTLLKNTFWVRLLRLRRLPLGSVIVMVPAFGVDLSSFRGIHLTHIDMWGKSCISNVSRKVLDQLYLNV